MKYKQIRREDITDKIIDGHSHTGFSIKAFASQEYPYAATIEGIYYRQIKGDVDINVVFPFTPELYLNVPELINGKFLKSHKPLSPAPYVTENQMLLKEIYEFCPEISSHFIPFISVDPGRDIQTQLDNIIKLSEIYPVYGIKIVPVFCQTPVTKLLTTGKAFLELAKEKNWPILLHTTVHAEEQYSRADMAFKVINENPDIRFCLAHCIGFHKKYLELANNVSNAWVDTAALKIQCQLAYENSPIVTAESERLHADYSDHTKVMRSLVEAFPNTIIWGSDIPAYSYICKRKQGNGSFTDFRLKASYEDEILALNSTPENHRKKICGYNTLDFLFGYE